MKKELVCNNSDLGDYIIKICQIVQEYITSLYHQFKIKSDYVGSTIGNDEYFKVKEHILNKVLFKNCVKLKDNQFVDEI
jgi:hypothetical protein